MTFFVDMFLAIVGVPHQQQNIRYYKEKNIHKLTYI